MKINTSITHTALALSAAILLAMVGSVGGATALTGQVVFRPLTPTEITDYGLPATTETSAGLNTVGVGQPLYLDALVNVAIPTATNVTVTWILTNKPIGSAAAFTGSPLGANVPTYKMADRLILRVGGRAMLRPDVAGQYVVAATISAPGSGSTNLTLKFSASTYMGAQVCAFCHSGGISAPDIISTYTNTAHASFFTRAIDGHESPYYNSSCIVCHTVGYDTNSVANNGGFDDIATQVGWTFPTTLTNGNWAAMPSSLQNLANIQCENCHGPGSEHAYAFGNTNLSNWPRIARTFGVGACTQCHDAEPYHVKAAEWSNSRHAISTRTPSGPGREACVRCHTANGFEDFTEHAGSTNAYVTNVLYEAIGCQTCHDPHDASNPHQLRAANIYTLPEGTTVTNAGLGALCMTCHHSRNGAASNNVAKFKLNQPTWAGGVSFGPHDSTAGDMVEGVNAIEYGKIIPSGSHSAVITNVCVGCHMQPVANTDPAYTQAGGHTFSMTYKVVNAGITNTLDKTDVCVKCHGPIEEFNFARKDYDGDGVIDGIQTEVQHLLDRLSTMLPNSSYRADGNYVADGLVKVIDRNTVKTNWPTKYLNGAWNYMFVSVEGSRGIHNAPYAIGVLKASIADLSGDANEDSLPDSWQIQYFGSANSSSAAPNACPAGDGVPNWLKYALGLNPLVPGIVVPDGVVWANAGSIGGSTNTVHIYTAAEVSFDTEVGKTYQIQSVGSLSGGWQNVGAPISGTGSAVSYVTPTRSNAQQFYRVVHSP